MARKIFCDRCNQELDYNHKVSIEYMDGNTTRIFREYHIDCFNYEFSTDVRQNIKKGEKK